MDKFLHLIYLTIRLYQVHRDRKVHGILS